MGGLLGALVIGLAFLKYENYPKIRWTIRLVLLGIGAALISKDSSTLGGLIAVLIFFPLVFGVIGVVIDLVINSSNKKTVATAKNEQSSINLNTSNLEMKNGSQAPASRKTELKSFESSAKTEDDIWEAALNEFESESRKNGLYAKLYALHKGDEALIKSEYIQQRFGELSEEAVARQQELQKQYQESWLARTTEEQRMKIQHYKIFYENGKFVFKYYRRTRRFSKLEEAISYAEYCEKL